MVTQSNGKEDDNLSIRNVVADYNIMSPDDFNAIIFNAYSKSLGKETRGRIIRQSDNHQDYSERQHRNQGGELVKAQDIHRQPAPDYDPTPYAPNHFKEIG